MKQLVLSLLLGLFPYWVPEAVWGCGGDAEAGSAELVMVVVDADVDAVVEGADEGAGKAMAWVGCNRTAGDSVMDGEASGGKELLVKLSSTRCRKRLKLGHGKEDPISLDRE